MGVVTRNAVIEDCSAISGIYNFGIAEGTATFETRKRSEKDIHEWFPGGSIIVVSEEGGIVTGFAATFPYSSRECYATIREFSVYVHPGRRGAGVGKALMQRLIAESRNHGVTKLVSRVFVENSASRSLLSSVGFREVGIYEKHGTINGNWKDVVIVEYIVSENL